MEKENMLVKKRSDQKEKKGSFKKKIIALVLALLVLLLLGSSLFILGVYKYDLKGGLSSNVVSLARLPVAIVNNEWILMEDFRGNVGSISHFYEIQNQMSEGAEQKISSEKEVKYVVLNRMIEDLILNQLATKYNVQVTNEEVEAEITSIRELSGEETDLETQTKELYGWTLEEFKKFALRPSLQEGKLQKLFFESEDVGKEVKTNEESKKQKANEVLTKIKNGENFESLAKEFSEDPGSKEEGGDLGYFTKGDMVEEFENAAFNLKAGEVSEVVKSPFGYHIIKVEEVLEENGEKKIKARHILFGLQDNFTEWILAEKKKASVKVFEKDLKWDQEKGEVVDK